MSEFLLNFLNNIDRFGILFCKMTTGTFYILPLIALSGLAIAQMPGMSASHVQVETASSGKDRIVRKSIGHTEAINTVKITAAVDGFLKEINFKEGSMVKAGDVLLQIDPLRYQAAVQQAEAALAQIEAQIIYASKRYIRLDALAKQFATSKEDMETALASLEELKAKKAGAEADLTKARKDLDDCTMRAEIDGRIGRLQYSAGNYIHKGEVLATITQIDPIYMRFPLSQYDVNSIFHGPKEITRRADVRLTTPDGRRYPNVGKVAIVDNRLADATDTYTLWAQFSNKDHVLTHRGIGALQVSLTDTADVTLVPLTAVQHDADGAFVYVVDDQNIVSLRNVVAGSIQGRLQSIYSGLQIGETVIVDGSHKTRVGATVVPVHVQANEQRKEAAIASGAVEEPAIISQADTVTEIVDPTVLTCQGARVEAINKVQLLPLVQGMLNEIHFKEGDRMNKNDVLFTIDPTRYKAIVETRKSEIAQLDVRIADAQVKYERQQKLLSMNATSKNDLESAKATLDELKARKSAAQAQLIIAEDDLSRCTIRCGLDGAQIGRVNLSAGNYITDLKTPLASIVQLSPIYVRFSLSENSMMSHFGNATNLIEQAEISLKTADGNTYTEKGHVSFCDNVIQPGTDTQNIWAFFDNKDRRLTPGGVVTIKVQRKPEFKVPSVISDAILVDTGGRYVYVAEEGHARKQYILCGSTNEEGRTAVFSGLEPGMKVLTTNLADMENGAPVQIQQ